ncbi:hypothetical protein [Burkholderia sp. LMG 13014]|uniref:hypothetical protein n=1 Tax=Burkholderia sp. LMG 13014 TaxID=2709306 RepID=UPI00196496E2|nr:hypothetical protein [Burkholderia sp. LMG 13014]
MSWDEETPRGRYRRDPQYRSLVTMLEAMIHQCKFTPSEIREAAVLASINYESMRVHQFHIPLTPELHERLRELDVIVTQASPGAAR